MRVPRSPRIVADVFLVVSRERCGIEGAQFHGADAQTLALEATDDVTDQTPLDGIGFEQDEGAGGHGMRLPLGQLAS